MTITFKDHLGLSEDALIVDTDTHLTEPPDLWTARAPARDADRVPHVERINERDMWVFDGVVLGAAGTHSAVDRDGEKIFGMQFLDRDYDGIHAGAWQIGPRLEVMDRLGIWAQIVYPNTFGFGGQRFVDAGDDRLRLLAVQLYNDASAEMQEASGNRLFAMAAIPWWDVDAAVAEIRRAAAIGLRGVNSGTGPHLQGLPDLGERFWDPMWDVCAELELPVNFHIGASNDTLSWFGTSPWPSHDWDHKLAIGSAMMYLSNAAVMANLIFSGVLERHPTLQFVSVESGIGWIPFFLQSLDYQQQQSTPTTYGTKFSLTPTEYFQRQMYGCFWFESRGLLETITALGDDRVLFETDYPHPTCLYPDGIATAAAALRELPDAARRKVLGENAIRLYRIPLPAS